MRHALALLASAALCHAAREAHAQPAAMGPVQPSGVTTETWTPATGASLLGRSGVNVGRTLLYGATEEERWRGIDRLATLGTPEGVDALLEALSSGSVIARDPASRLLVVRLLSKHADRAEVRSHLARELMDGAARRDTTPGLSTMLRQSAALALARRGDEAALEPLVNAALMRGPAGDAARAALLVEPPPSLDLILVESSADDDDPSRPREEGADEPRPFPGEASRDRGAKPPKKRAPAKAGKDKTAKDANKAERVPRVLLPQTLSFLGDLGDLRAIPTLRGEVLGSHRPSRAAAAVALAKLGDAQVAETVVPWLDDAEPRLVAAAAEVLVIVGHARAPEAVKRVIAQDATRSAGIQLAHDLGSSALAPTLAKTLGALDGADAVRAVMALGRSGAAKEIAKHVEHAELGPAAITALGTCSAAETERILSDGIGAREPARRRAFVRAALVHEIVLGRRAAGLEEALAEMGRSKDEADLEVAAFGAVLLGLASAEDALSGKPSLAVVGGAARAALHRRGEALRAFAPLLSKLDPEKPDPVAVAAGLALLDEEVSDTVPFKVLLRLAENGGPLAALAARALPRRDDGTMRERIEALLVGTDPAVRVAVALGYADAVAPSTVSVLASRYLREEDDRVRRAIVWSLARRTEPQRERILQMARDVDPDAEVRRLAWSGLRARRPAPLTASDPGAAVFVRVDAGEGASAMRAFRMTLPSGLAIPVVSAPDGGLLVAGVPFGRSALEIAP